MLNNNFNTISPPTVLWYWIRLLCRRKEGIRYWLTFLEAVLKCFQEILRMIFEVFLRVEEGAMRAYCKRRRSQNGRMEDSR